MLAITPQELDADCYLLCTPEATYDLRLGMAGGRAHHPGDFMTKVTSVSPSDKGADLWQKQLDLLFGGDRDLMDYVQLVAGTACIGKVFIEQMIIAYGCGANGKSTFWNTLARVLGTYSGNVSSDALTVGNRRNIKPEMAELKGKRLVIAAELEEGTRLNTATVKQMCSTDEVYAEKSTRTPSALSPAIRWYCIPTICPRSVPSTPVPGGGSSWCRSTPGSPGAATSKTMPSTSMRTPVPPSLPG